MNAKLGLCQMLGLRPLDRLQINDPHEIRELRSWRQIGGLGELPFFFFQRIVGDRLEVCSPSGYVTRVLPEDVCNYISGEPIMVRAMSNPRFLERTRLPLADRQGPVGDEWYDDAYVLAVEKDRWGRPDRVWVHFVDDCLNSEARSCAPIADASRQMLATLCRRTRMPVISGRGGSASADAGVAKAEDQDRHLTARFIASVLKGHQAGVSVLAMAGAKPVTTATLNRLGVPMPARV